MKLMREIYPKEIIPKDMHITFSHKIKSKIYFETIIPFYFTSPLILKYKTNK